MPKDVNIHLKTTGADQTQAELNKTAQATQQVGDEVQQTGRKAQASGGLLDSFIRRFAGPLGFLAILESVRRLTRGVADFFDSIKERADEAVQQLENVRSGFTDIFEALDAYDEKSRTEITKQTYGLLKKTAVSEEVGLPIIEAYIRQFKGKMPAGEYEKGLEAALHYAQLHAGPQAGANLIRFMPGLGADTPDKQAELMRQISALSQASGIKDEEIIGALGQAMPAIKALGWSPSRGLEAIAKIAAGQTERHVKAAPGATMEALRKPSAEKLGEYGFEESLAERPDEALAALAEAYQKGALTRKVKRKGLPPRTETITLDRQRFITMLGDIYGEGAAPDLFAMFEPPPSAAASIAALEKAVTPEAAAEVEAQIETDAQSLEGMARITQAAVREMELEVTDLEKIMEKVREIGAQRRKILGRTEPFRMATRNFFAGEKKPREYEYGAYKQWETSLAAEELEQIEREFPTKGSQFALYAPGVTPPPYVPSTIQKWQSLTSLQKWQALTRSPRQAPPQLSPPPPGLESPESFAWPPPEETQQAEPNRVGPVSYNYDHRVIHQTIFNPVVGMNKQDLRIEPPYLG